MTKQRQALGPRKREAVRLEEYVAQVVAQAPPISAVARARLAAVFSSVNRRAA